MNIDKKKLSIQILAITGLVLSIKLAMIYYFANYDKYALSSFCSINDFIDCDGAAKSDVAQVLGIPLAYWGIFFYITVLFLTFVNKLKNVKYLHFLEVFKNPKAYIATLGTIAFICSMVLAGLSIFKIHKLCVLCCVTYVLDLIIATIAADGLFKNILKSFKDTVLDFIDGAKKYTKTFITLLIASVTFLCYSGISLNFVPHIKARNEILKYKNIKYNPYRIKGNLLGNKDGNVIIELFSDYVCPLCYVHNIMLHKAATEFSNIKIIHYNLPFDRLCNPYIGQTIHPYACFMAKGAIAARNQNNYWEMASLLYENQPQTLEDVLKLAKTAGLNEEIFLRDFNSIETEKELFKEINFAQQFDIDATPTMIINGDKVVGVKPYKELKEVLVKHGAKLK